MINAPSRGMPLKLIIQIPCYNEAETLAIALSALPVSVAGFDTVETLVINDGSTDNTAQIARDFGVNHIVDLKTNQGLAKGFMAGIRECLHQGADVIVNTDADNQYEAQDIPRLVEPMLSGRADYVIGERPIKETAHFSTSKKLLQGLGSWVVRKASGTDIPDAPSGFRALSRACAEQLNVYNNYTYTLETIIQAGRRGMAICSVPIRTNEDLRPSKLLSSIPNYIKRSAITIVRIFVVYQPFRSFMAVAITLILSGLLLGLRYLYFKLTGDGAGHIQSVIVMGVLLVVGFQTALIAFIADLLAVNRTILEDLRNTQRNSEAGKRQQLPDHAGD